jgi:hypothetical protein
LPLLFLLLGELVIKGDDVGHAWDIMPFVCANLDYYWYALCAHVPTLTTL